MTEIDFLPDEYLKRRVSQRDQWVLVGIAAAVFLVLVGSMVAQSRRRASLRQQLASLESEQADVLALVQELEKLEKQRDELIEQANFISLLRARPAVSRLLVAVAASCPAHVTLQKIKMRPVKRIEGTVEPPTARKPKQRNAAKPDEILRAEQLAQFTAERRQSQWNVELEGLAESDMQVLDLIDRLERTDCFQQVTLAETGNGTEQSALALRHFTIKCWVPKVLP